MLLNVDTIHEGTRFRIKDREKARVFQGVCAAGGSTRKALARSLKLRPTTVSRVTQELLEDRLLVERRAPSGGGKGRPGVPLESNYDRLMGIAVYVVSRQVRAALVNLNEKIIERRSAEVPAEADNAEMRKRIVGLLRPLIGQLPARAELVGVGASLPGTVNPGRGRWVSSARWPRLADLRIGPLLDGLGVRSALHRSLDPELAFLLLKNRPYRRGGTVLFHWGYGIGSAYAYDGAVLRSGLGRFGEVGHWQITETEGRRCRCGLFGCLETEAALWALLPAIRETNPGVPEGEPEFARYAAEGRLDGLPVIHTALNHVCRALGNLHKIFYPDRLLLLGPFTASDALFGALRRQLKTSLPEYAREAFTIRRVAESGGEILGSLLPLFREALRPLLRTRSDL